MNYPKPTEDWIAKTMKTLEVTREEALEVWMDDHDIDAGKVKPFDLDPAKQKVVKEMTKATRKPANYSLDGAKKRERKPNEEKRAIIEALFYSLCDYHHAEEECIVSHIDEVETVNPEREITFKIGEKCYSLTLTLHRPAKNAQK